MPYSPTTVSIISPSVDIAYTSGDQASVMELKDKIILIFFIGLNDIAYTNLYSYDMNTRIVNSISFLQTAQVSILGIHWTQANIWAHGRATMFTSSM